MDKLCETYKLETTGMCANVVLMTLIGTILSVIPLLLNHSDAIFYTSQSFYITIVILFACLIYFKKWGIFISIVLFSICSFLSDLPTNRVLFVNFIINIVQILFCYIAYLIIKKLKYRNNNKYSKGIFYLSKYNFILILLFVLYLIFYAVTDLKLHVVLLFFSITFLSTIFKSIIKKDLHLLLYTFLIALLPSFICSSLSAFLSNVPNSQTLDYIFMWSMSNYILLQTSGYIVFQILYTKPPFSLKNDEVYNIDISSIAYYVAILCWNILLLYFISVEAFGNNKYAYFFPWILGNILFGLNLCFSFQNDTCNITDDKEKFKWYENRVVVVENNTSYIITIISLLLPIGVKFMYEIDGVIIPSVLLMLFIANIFFAIMAVGLIWIPQSNIKFIAFLKSLKTIFYLYSISLLLISVIMLILTIAPN